jgi:hypothetical protein
MDAKQTAVRYLKKMVFPYLTHEEKMLTGQFFYKAEMMEKEQIEKAYQAGDGDAYNLKETKTWAEQYYNETYNK